MWSHYTKKLLAVFCLFICLFVCLFSLNLVDCYLQEFGHLVPEFLIHVRHLIRQILQFIGETIDVCCQIVHGSSRKIQKNSNMYIYYHCTIMYRSRFDWLDLSSLLTKRRLLGTSSHLQTLSIWGSFPQLAVNRRLICL